MNTSRTELDTQITEWRSETEDSEYFGAQVVQDRLLDLYGALRAYPVVSQVEEWLRLTRERNLFEGKEITALLDDIEAELDRA